MFWSQLGLTFSYILSCLSQQIVELETKIGAKQAEIEKVTVHVADSLLLWRVILQPHFTSLFNYSLHETRKIYVVEEV